MEGCHKKSKYHQRPMHGPVGLGIAACALALALGLPAVSDAALLSIASATGTAANTIIWINDPQYGFDLSGNCYDPPGDGSCVSVTAPGPLLASYNDMTLSVSQVNSQGPAVPVAGSSTYVEQYLLSAGSSPDYGTIAIGTYSAGSTNPTLLSANVTGYSIFAANGATSALIDLDLANTVIGAGIAGFTVEDLGTTYLLLTGASSAPVSISGGQFVGSIDLDWSGTVSTTPYTPVPLPASGGLMLGALAGCGLLLRPRGSAIPGSRA
jgi:hypothetical protein